MWLSPFLFRCASLPVLLVAVSLPVHADDSVLVSELLTLIQRGINAARPEIDRMGNVPPLDSVTLQLQTETQEGASAGINLWFVKIGGGKTNTASTQMTLILKPATSGRSAVSAVPLDETIKNTLIAAAKGVHDAQAGATGVPLLLDSLSADFGFTVKKSGSGGIEFKLVPIGGSATVDVAKTDVHKITVKFAKPGKSEPPKSN
jgi:hypothetical protein